MNIMSTHDDEILLLCFIVKMVKGQANILDRYTYPLEFRKRGQSKSIKTQINLPLSHTHNFPSSPLVFKGLQLFDKFEYQLFFRYE